MFLPLVRHALTLLIFTTCMAARAEVPEIKGAAPAPSKSLDQAIYKGVVGNLLDAVPIDPGKRVDLQRTNAVVSSVFSGRTLATLLGVANPALMVGGLAWGLWSASRIKPVPATAQAAAPHGAARAEDSRHVSGSRSLLPVVPLLPAPQVKPAVAESGGLPVLTARLDVGALADAGAAQAAAD